MIERTTCHLHSFTYNDDGFEVCSKCGLCTNAREFLSNLNSYCVGVNSVNNEFTHILSNYHIGYENEIVEEYKKIKKIIRGGYPNIVIFAYCTYNVLLNNGVYYSLHHIANMFKIISFKKKYCRINKHLNLSYDISNDIYVHSAINQFLSQYNQHKIIGKVIINRKRIKEIFKYSSANLLSVLALYISLYKTFETKKILLHELSFFFNINYRTIYNIIQVYFKATT